MQAYDRVHVQLEKKDRKQISGMLNKGRESARIWRALILRQLDRGQTAVQVAGSVSVAPKTVRAIARCHEEERLEQPLYEKPCPDKRGCWTRARVALSPLCLHAVATTPAVRWKAVRS
jgi:hypothetical protein